MAHGVQRDVAVLILLRLLYEHTCSFRCSWYRPSSQRWCPYVIAWRQQSSHRNSASGNHNSSSLLHCTRGIETTQGANPSYPLVEWLLMLCNLTQQHDGGRAPHCNIATQYSSSVNSLSFIAVDKGLRHRDPSRVRGAHLVAHAAWHPSPQTRGCFRLTTLANAERYKNYRVNQPFQ